MGLTGAALLPRPGFWVIAANGALAVAASRRGETTIRLPRLQRLWPVAVMPPVLAAVYWAVRRTGLLRASPGDIRGPEPVDTACVLLYPDGTRREIIAELLQRALFGGLAALARKVGYVA